MCLLTSCAVKVDEDQAHMLMEKIYKARKDGSFYKEFTLYAQDEFAIVPFAEVANTLRTVIGSAGRFISAKHLHTKVSRRNQLGKGLVSYLVLTFAVKYSNRVMEEAYYFAGDSTLPKIVYITLQLP